MSSVDLAQAMWLLVSAIGLSLAVSYAGLPVLGQGAFMAIGAFGTALLGPGGQGWPLVIACLASVLLAAVVGYALSRGSSRLEGAHFALATWALAWLVDRVLVGYPDLSGGSEGLTRAGPAHLRLEALGVDLALTPNAHLAVAGVLCVAGLAGLARIQRGPGALDLAALRESPELATSLGVPVAARRRTVLTVTAALGALSGAGSTVLLGLVTPADVSPLVSLELFVAVLIAGAARWWGPLLGIAILSALPAAADALSGAAGADQERSRGLATALLLLAVLALRGPVSRRLTRPGAAPADRTDALNDQPATQPADVVLTLSGTTVSFDGLRALDDAHLDLRRGEVHGLVGPNGSGKSTLLRVLAGEIAAGRVELYGQPLSSAVEARVREGVVRTPQQTVLMPRLTADAQVTVGARARGGSPGAVIRHLLATPSSRSDHLEQLTEQALRDVGLGHVIGADALRLTVGDQRLLQVARAVATGATVLLLDEPAAGMSADERQRLAQALRRLASQGRAVLLVEHDLGLVAEVADRVTVLSGGRVRSTGRPSEVDLGELTT